MDIGMLWFDDDPKRTLDQKIQRAADYYLGKYGQPATLCHLNPIYFDGKHTAVTLRLVPNKSVLRNHFWLGVAEDKPA